MENDLLKAARREVESLRLELAKNPVFQKLQQVQRLIDVYESYEGGADNPQKEEASSHMHRLSPIALTKPGTKLAQVEKIVLDYCWETGQRHFSGQLMSVLLHAGVELGGKVPSKTLASMLSNSKKLNNLKGYGYGPIEWGDKPSVKGETNEASPGKPEDAS